MHSKQCPGPTFEHDVAHEHFENSPVKFNLVPGNAD
jgi:hypothetical protein